MQCKTYRNRNVLFWNCFNHYKYFSFAVKIRDIIAYESVVIKQLGDLGVKPEVSRTLLDSSFSFVEVFNIFINSLNLVFPVF